MDEVLTRARGVWWEYGWGVGWWWGRYSREDEVEQLAHESIVVSRFLGRLAYGLQ